MRPGPLCGRPFSPSDAVRRPCGAALRLLQHAAGGAGEDDDDDDEFDVTFDDEDFDFDDDEEHDSDEMPSFTNQRRSSPR